MKPTLELLNQARQLLQEGTLTRRAISRQLGISEHHLGVLHEEMQAEGWREIMAEKRITEPLAQIKFLLSRRFTQPQIATVLQLTLREVKNIQRLGKDRSPENFILTFGRYATQRAGAVPAGYLADLILAHDPRLTAQKRNWLATIPGVKRMLQRKAAAEARAAKRQEDEAAAALLRQIETKVKQEAMIERKASRSKMCGLPGDPFAGKVRVLASTPVTLPGSIGKRITFETPHHNILFTIMGMPPEFPGGWVTLEGVIKGATPTGDGWQTFISRATFPELEERT